MRGFLLIIFWASVLATAQAAEKWVEASTTRSLPGQESVRAKTYFEDSFGRKKGKFKAAYESFLEEKDFVEGEFLVARFRYVYAEPNTGESSFYPTHDESITKVLLDCKNHFSGTISITYKLKGKVAKHDETSDRDIHMMQYSGPSTVEDLCAFAKKQRAVP
jgi:hypothetical protein